MSTVRWAVVGPGRIASKVVGDFVHVPGAELVAVASRSAERGAAFAAVHGIARVHTSYADVVADPEVDALYIATPHPQHRAVTLAALRAGKAVLVEKAFTVTPAATREIVDVAERTGTFAMEGMWTRFQPAVVRMRELIADGAIGEVRSVAADLGVRPPVDPIDRFYNPAIGGGALFDVGVYPISFAQMVLGDPDTVAVTGSLAATGVDVEEAVQLGYADGRSASLFASLLCATPGQARVYGTAGWIDVLPRFHHPDTIVLHRAGHEPETITRPALGGGYSHELIEVTECVAAGRPQSAVMPLADTVAVQDVMGEVAERLGMVVHEGPATL
ncbi:Gfo/Idh/MocA family protein [Pseudonocardia lacus]|uniref:Gfo/Idh/MocA family protein n=1 Tax=Pseudonocardia lacus TaxID=2835865 RepID=UPI001BDD3A61|nr:Gfo/Idh/MocA family oxidoreductase [Pseudonocardia lacus]